MPKVTLSSKHQITLPAEIVRSMGLKPGDKLIAEALDWRIVIIKESENRLERYVGSLRGVYGKSVEEIDRYVREERRSWDRDESLPQFEDLIAADPATERIVDILLESPRHTLSRSELRDRQRKGMRAHHRGFGDAEFEEIIKNLIASGGVRRLPPQPELTGLGDQYNLVLEAAERHQREHASRARK